MDTLIRKTRSAAVYAFLGLVALLSLFPFVWMVISATNVSNEISKGRMSFGPALMENYAKFAAAYDVGVIFWNSAKIALLASFFTLLVSSLAGYGFEVFSSKLRERIYRIEFRPEQTCGAAGKIVVETGERPDEFFCRLHHYINKRT